MSHVSGKVEMIGINEKQTFFKYHRAADERNTNRLIVFSRNPNAFWFDDYLEAFPEKSFNSVWALEPETDAKQGAWHFRESIVKIWR